MKVLFWVNKFPAFSETFIRDQIISLIDENISVLVYANEKNNNKELDAISNYESYSLLDKKVDIECYVITHKAKRFFKALNILFLSIFNGHFLYYLRSLNIKSFGRKAKSLHLFFQVHFILKNKIDVIHAHFGPNGNNAVLFKKIGMPIKLFTTFHGYDIRLGIDKGGKIYHELFKYSDGVFSISEFNHQNLIKFGAPKSKVFSLTNGIDLEFYKRYKPVTTTGVLKILTVARLVEEKDLNVAIRAIYKLKRTKPTLSFEYVIVGEGPKREELQGLIDSLGLTENIKLLGAKNSGEVRDFMLLSDLFLLSSKSEALPTVLLEAQASELVVLATDVGAIGSMVKGGVVVPKLDVNLFSNGLLALVNNRNDWQQLAKLGREHVLNTHNIKSQTQKLVSFYKS